MTWFWKCLRLCLHLFIMLACAYVRRKIHVTMFSLLSFGSVWICCAICMFFWTVLVWGCLHFGSLDPKQIGTLFHTLSQGWQKLCAIGILTSIERLSSSNSDGFIVGDGVHLVIIVSIVSRSWGDSKLNWLTRLRLHTILCHICTKLRPILSWYEWWWSQWGKQSLHWSLHRMVSFIAEATAM